MSDYSPQVGDRVALTVRGRVTRATEHSIRVVWGPNRDGFNTYPGYYWFTREELGEDLTIERLPDPDPAWWPPQDGDVALDEQGAAFQWWADDGWCYGTSTVVTPHGRLKLVARGGEAYEGEQ